MTGAHGQDAAYIGLRSGDNASELSDVPPEKLELYNKIYSEPVHGQIRVPRTKWVVLRYPSASMAQQAGMSTEAFEDYYFNVCCLDYSKMARAMEPLIALMNRTDRVVLKGPGKTDLSFSIRRDPGHRVRRRNEYSGRRGVYCAGARERQRGDRL